MSEDIQKRLQLLLGQLNERVYGKQQFIALGHTFGSGGRKYVFAWPSRSCEEYDRKPVETGFQGCNSF